MRGFKFFGIRELLFLLYLALSTSSTFDRGLNCTSQSFLQWEEGEGHPKRFACQIMSEISAKFQVQV